MKIPPRIILSGNREAAAHLRRRALVELDILVQAIGFQRLNQGQRIIRMAGEAFIKCQYLFGQSVVWIHVPHLAPAAGAEKIEQHLCWCSACFAEATITRVIGDYGDRGDYATAYPGCCNQDSTIGDYVGVRYEATICQRTAWGPFVCIPSDFAAYQAGERVIVLFNGRWTAQAPYVRQATRCGDCLPCRESAPQLCAPCNANRRPGRAGDEPDGSFTILPMEP